MNGADAMVKCLEMEGVKAVFGYPGVAICPFYNSILDSEIESVLVRTEQTECSACGKRTCPRIGSGGSMCGNFRSRCHKSDHRYCNRICGQHSNGMYHRTGKQ